MGGVRGDRDDPRLDQPDQRFTLPFDAADPRYAGSEEASREHRRELVPAEGPGLHPHSRAARILRIGVPAVFFAGVLLVMAVFFVGLDPGSTVEVVGEEAAVRAAVIDRPRRVCLNDQNPCAWLTLFDDRLLAFNTSGPIRDEYGRMGVSWCASSGYFGANSTGSRYDPAGRVVRGPAPRGMDRFDLRVRDGRVLIDFRSLTTGLQAHRVDEVVPPAGQHCDEIPFDREADLDLSAG